MKYMNIYIPLPLPESTSDLDILLSADIHFQRVFQKDPLEVASSMEDSTTENIKKCLRAFYRENPNLVEGFEDTPSTEEINAAAENAILSGGMELEERKLLERLRLTPEGKVVPFPYVKQEHLAEADLVTRDFLEENELIVECDRTRAGEDLPWWLLFWEDAAEATFYWKAWLKPRHIFLNR